MTPARFLREQRAFLRFGEALHDFSYDPGPDNLARYLAASTGLPQPTAVRVVADMATYFSETVEEFVRRRHIELRQRQRKNHEIWPLIAAELGQRRFAAPGLSERQLRRIVYG